MVGGRVGMRTGQWWDRAEAGRVGERMRWGMAPEEGWPEVGNITGLL